MREIRTGGIAKLKTHMERATRVKFISRSNPQRSSNQRFNFGRAWMWFLNLGSNLRRGPGKGSSLPSHNTSQHRTTARGTHSPARQRQQNLLLMSCTHKGEYGRFLYQDQIDDLDSDQKLFHFLGARFREHRGKFRSMLSLRTVKGIHFIQVSFYQSATRRALIS